MKKLPVKKSLNIKALGKINPLVMVEGIKIMVEASVENYKTIEQEKTKRKKIQALKEVEIKKIKATKETINTYMQGCFNERKDVLDKLNKFYEKENDVEGRMKLIDAIVDLAKHNPLEGFSKFKNNLDNNDVIDI